MPNDSTAAQIIAGMVAALLVGGTAPWWWQEFFSTKEPESLVSIEPEPPKPRRTSITVAYRGDDDGCSLPISISIAGYEFYPEGNFYQVSDIELGQQGYQISGQISCPTLGICEVFGEGTIDVVSNSVYYLIWAPTSWGQCSIVLQANI